MSQPDIREEQAQKYNDDCMSAVEYLDNFNNSIEEFGIEEFGMHYGLVLSLLKIAERMLVLDSFPNSQFIDISEKLSELVDEIAEKYNK